VASWNKRGGKKKREGPAVAAGRSKKEIFLVIEKRFNGKTRRRSNLLGGPGGGRKKRSRKEQKANANNHSRDKGERIGHERIPTKKQNFLGIDGMKRKAKRQKKERKVCELTIFGAIDKEERLLVVSERLRWKGTHNRDELLRPRNKRKGISRQRVVT